MDDAIKILLGLLFLGFSIYNSTRKKKNRALKLAQEKKRIAEQEKAQEFEDVRVEPHVSYENTDNDLSFFEVFKKEVIDNIDTSKTQTSYNFEQEVIDTEEPQKIEYDDNKTHSGLKINEEDFIDFDELNEGKEVEKFDFDLEKAVIYSEILKPKYF